MKILIAAPYITHEVHPAFQRNQTGLGYMIHDMASSIGYTEDVDVFCFYCFTPELKVDGFRVLARSWSTVLRSIKLCNVYDFIAFVKRYRPVWKKWPRTFYTFLAIGQLESIVRQYDVVHVQQCTALLYGSLRACQRQGVSCLTTLHGLVSFEEKVTAEVAAKRLERGFLKEAAENNLPVTFISTGIKNIAADFVGLKNPTSFYVVPNGTKIVADLTPSNKRALHHISDNVFVFACVGNLSPWKNQNQVMRAYALLPDEVQQRVKVLFIGRETDGGELHRMINEKGFQNSLLVLGGLPVEEVRAYYAAANATILASVSEGFGLSIIEGMAAGLPNLTFSDLPAVPDLYDEKAMVVVKERTDEALAEGMMKIVQTKWDNGYIKEYAQKFSLANMAKQYIAVYKSIAD